MESQPLKRITALVAILFVIIYLNYASSYPSFLKASSPEAGQDLSSHGPVPPSDVSEIRNNYGWRLQEQRAHEEFIDRLIADAESAPSDALKPVIADFLHFIETSPRITMYFTQMFREDPWAVPYWRQQLPKKRLSGYKEFVRVLNQVLVTPPQVGLAVPPMSLFMSYPMSTPSGHHAFLDPEVNEMLKTILNEWGRYLKSPESANVLGTDDKGWFGTQGLASLEAEANNPYNTSAKFAEVYQCDPTQEHHGYQSWDDFFTRKFREGARPVASPEDDNVIVNSCESIPFNVQTDVKLRDEFFIKGEPYSVVDMLGNDPLSEEFVGGTVYQAFLSMLAYHRWHAPVSGTIRRSFLVNGTYYSDHLYQGMATSGTQEVGTLGIGKSLSYLSAVAARGVVIIEADNPAIGLVAVVGIGMEEVSTCDITIQEGQHVKKGEELGMFHFGGSTYCLIFQDGVVLEEFPPMGYFDSPNQALNSKLAVVKTSTRQGREGL